MWWVVRRSVCISATRTLSCAVVCAPPTLASRRRAAGARWSLALAGLCSISPVASCAVEPTALARPDAAPSDAEIEDGAMRDAQTDDVRYGDGGRTLDRADFCSSISERHVSSVARCNAGEPEEARRVAAALREDCLARSLVDYEFQAEEADRCLAQWYKTSCDVPVIESFDLLEFVPGCSAVFVPVRLRETGADCRASPCAGHCSRCSGYLCIERRAPGEGCAEEECAAGARCALNPDILPMRICKLEAAVGAECGGTRPCAQPGLFCNPISRRCDPVLAPGDRCRADIGPSGCAWPDVCRPMSPDAPLSSSVCQAPLELGALCAGFGARPCGANQACIAPAPGAPLRCHMGRPRGSRCDDQTYSCHTGSVCIEVADEPGVRRCAPLPGLGEACLEGPFACQLNFVCGPQGRCEYGCGY
jgi:hypothetical protein